ncbi:MAG: ATP synthase subunit I [Acidobacteriaceae bacterium]|nr:ATP synthase subunit I [Acidobacteriaceae bacterium]
MTDFDAPQTIRRLYWLTGLFGLVGVVSYFVVQGTLSAAGFAIGALSSFGNLWIFERISHSIAPGDEPKKTWKAGAFVIRYFILFFVAYATIKTLGVNPLAVILGLLASTAAVLTSITYELFRSLLSSRSRTE